MIQWGEFQGRIEDNRLVTGQGLYVADIAPERTAHAVVVRAQVASARITSIDTVAALASPGVLAVYTGKDLAADGLPDFPCAVELKRPNGEKAHQARRPILVRDRIRAVGEPVAFVVGSTPTVVPLRQEFGMLVTPSGAIGSSTPQPSVNRFCSEAAHFGVRSGFTATR